MNPVLLLIFLTSTLLQGLANIALVAACATYVFKSGGVEVVKADLASLESGLKAEILEIKSKL